MATVLISVVAPALDPRLERAAADVCVPGPGCVSEQAWIDVANQMVAFTIETAQFALAFCGQNDCQGLVVSTANTALATANDYAAWACSSGGTCEGYVRLLAAEVVAFALALGGAAAQIVGDPQPWINLAMSSVTMAQELAQELAAGAPGYAATAVQLATLAVEIAGGVVTVAPTLIPAALDIANLAIGIYNDLAAPVVNSYVQALTSFATQPDAAVQLVVQNAQSIAATAGQLVQAVAGPTADAAVATAMQTLAAGMAAMQGMLLTVMSQVPGDLGTALAQAQQLAAAALPTVLATAAQVQALAAGIAGTAAGTAYPEADGASNTGVDPIPPASVDANQDYGVTADKLLLAKQLEPQVVYALAKYADALPGLPTAGTRSEVAPYPFGCDFRITQVTMTRAASACSTPGTAPTPQVSNSRSKVLDGVPVYLQQEKFTCGPSTARAVLHYMTGTLHDELTVRTDMKTTKRGSSVQYMQETLNRMQSKDTFFAEQLSNGPEQLMTRVVAVVHPDASASPHPVVLNLNHSHLGYWNRPLNPEDGHFNYSHGYDFSGGGSLWLGDAGTEAVLGHHFVDLEEVYGAVRANIVNNGKIVW